MDIENTIIQWITIQVAGPWGVVLAVAASLALGFVKKSWRDKILDIAGRVLALGRNRPQ